MGGGGWGGGGLRVQHEPNTNGLVRTMLSMSRQPSPKNLRV